MYPKLSAIAFALLAFAMVGCGSSSESDVPDSVGDVADEVDVASPECVADGDCPSVNPCNVGVCAQGVCASKLIEGPCDDQDPCTLADQCQQGFCVGVPKECDNGLWCDGIESCDGATGACTDGVPPSDDDGVACTTEVCDEDKDQISHIPDDLGCADSDPCTTDYCDLAVGCLSIITAGLACDDGDGCTQDDLCNSQGKCVGTPKECGDGVFCNGLSYCDPQAGQCLPGETPHEIDDGIDCTVDSCDEVAKKIIHQPDHAACDDGNPCTTEICSAEAKGCVYSELNIVCDDGDLCTINDICSLGQCKGTPLACDDGLVCNGTEFCDQAVGECIAGEGPVTEDDVDCTVDYCIEEPPYVVNEPDHDACDDGDPCTTDLCLADQGCVNELDNCQAELCYYTSACLGAAGAQCQDAIPLNFELPILFQQEFTQTFEALPDNDLATPYCVAPEADGNERWFSFTTEEQRYVRFTVVTSASGISFALYKDSCDGSQEGCFYTGGDTTLSEGLVLPAGTYLLVVDIPSLATEFTLTVSLPKPE